MSESHGALGSELSARLGGVLSYRCGGRMAGVCGQTVGADGAGEFALLVRGTPEDAEKFSREHIKAIEAIGHKVEYAIFVPNGSQFGYFGNPLRMVDA